MKVLINKPKNKEGAGEGAARYDQSQVLSYYEESGPDYATWSPEYNMHFGYYVKGMNFLDREIMLQQMNHEVFDRLQIDPFQPGNMTDLGCGLGASLRYAASLFPDMSLTGVTVVPWQIRMGVGLNAFNPAHTSIQLLEEDYRSTSIPDQSQNAVYAIESSCYASGADKEDLLKEIHRILKPGGRFVIADGFLRSRKKMNPVLKAVYRKLCDSWALEELGHVEKVSNKLDEIGFTEIQKEDISWKVAPSVAHVPFTVAKFLIKQFLFGKRRMSSERWGNLISPLLTMIVGLAQNHFGYYLISGRK